jgi:hypothetical protein
MLRLARAVLFFVVPAELLFVVLLVSGVPMPLPVVVAAETVVAAVFVLETTIAYRLFRAARRGGADRRAAVRATVGQLVPVQVRRLMEFETKGMASLFLWVARRRDGVPPGATAVAYAREQTTMIVLLLFVMIVETVGLEILLQAFDVPLGIRMVVLVLDLYSILFALTFGAACVVRPHVVSAGELRVRFGVFFDLRIPREVISSVRLSRNYNESGMIAVADGRLGVVVSSQTNVIVELTEPITVVRPLGGRTQVSRVRFFADNPDAALRALRPLDRHAAP